MHTCCCIPLGELCLLRTLELGLLVGLGGSSRVPRPCVLLCFINAIPSIREIRRSIEPLARRRVFPSPHWRIHPSKVHSSQPGYTSPRSCYRYPSTESKHNCQQTRIHYSPSIVKNSRYSPQAAHHKSSNPPPFYPHSTDIPPLTPIPHRSLHSAGIATPLHWSLSSNYRRIVRWLRVHTQVNAASRASG